MHTSVTPALRELRPRQIGEIEISLDQVVDPIGHHRAVLPIEINIVRPEQAQSAANPQVLASAIVLRLGELREQIIPLIRSSQLAEAREKIAAYEKLLQSKGPLPPEVATELAKLQQMLQDAESVPPELSAKAAHYAISKALSQEQEACGRAGDPRLAQGRKQRVHVCLGISKVRNEGV